MKRLAVSTLVVLSLYAGSASAAILGFRADLNGFNEVNASGVPGQGDPDGSGTAFLFIDDSTPIPTIQWSISAFNIAFPLTGAHIHQAPAGVNGPIVVDFSSQLSGSGLQDADLANVIANPSGFYVNLHNATYPAGAIRGQLVRDDSIPEPSTLSLLFGGAFVVWAASRRRRRS